MDKLRWSIEIFLLFLGLLLRKILRLGNSVYHMLNLLTIGLCIVLLNFHLLKLFMVLTLLTPLDLLPLPDISQFKDKSG